MPTGVEPRSLRRFLAPRPISILPRDFCTLQSDHHAFMDFRVAVAAGFAGTAEGNGLQDRDIVFHHRRFADDNAGCVVKHNAAADFWWPGGYPHQMSRKPSFLKVGSQRAAVLVPQPVGDTVCL